LQLDNAAAGSVTGAGHPLFWGGSDLFQNSCGKLMQVMDLFSGVAKFFDTTNPSEKCPDAAVLAQNSSWHFHLGAMWERKHKYH